MPQSWTLLDQKSNHLVANGWTAAAAETGVADITAKVTHHAAGLSQGVTTVELDNGPLRVTVVPTRGMGLWRLECNGQNLGWQSPVRGPVHPALVPLVEPSGLGWLDGFDEFMVRCGLESNGAPEFDDDGRLAYPLHGRIANRPAYHVELQAADGALRLVGKVEETRFHFLKLRLTSTLTIRPGATGIELSDTVENLSASPAETQMLYHVNFGPPLLDAGAQVVLPAAAVVPRNAHAAADVATWNSYAAPQAGYEEQVYFCQLRGDDQGRSRALLKNAHGTLGASLRFDIAELPCFTIWKNTTALEDGCVTGLEPGTNFPNPRGFEGEKGRVRKLAPHASVSYQLGIDCHPNESSVRAAEQQIAALQGEPPTIASAPLPDWCAG